MWPPCRHDWHHIIQCPKPELTVAHCCSPSPPLASAFVVFCGGCAPEEDDSDATAASDGSGQPRCCWQMEQRGNGFLQ